MAAVAAANESDLLQATDAGLQPAPTPAAALDPQLLMAARRGDSWTLKDLLQLNDDDSSDDQQSTTTTMSVAVTFCCCCVKTEHVIVEVDPQRDDAVDAPLPSPPVSVLDEDEATIEGESLSETVEQVMEPPPPHDDDVAALPARQTPAAAPAGHSAVLLVLDDTEEGSRLVDSEIVEQVVDEPPLPHDDAAPPARQPPAAAPAGSFLAAVPVLDEDGVTMEGDSLLHVVAACGDTQEFLDCANMIVRNKEKKGGAGAKRRALEARNNKGDTPLHCAARAGNVKMISCLVDLLTEATAADEVAVKTFLGRKNRCGETALHQAVRAASKAAIDKLLSVDPELACSSSSSSSRGREKDAGGAACSPFFLAVSLWGEDDEMDIARHLFLKTRPSIRSNLSYYCSGPDGRNVLHAAVSRASVKTVILLSQLLTSADAASVETQTPPGRLLLLQLASQRDKQNGSTPLHLAASLGGLPSSLLLFAPKVRPPPPEATPLWPLDQRYVGYNNLLFRLFGYGLRYWLILPVMLPLVLNANVGMAYQPDKAGLYPIHVAAGSGSRYAVWMLVQRCPDCATLRDAKGRTFLHVAAEEGRYDVVEYVCELSQKQSRRARLLSSILNAQDMNGDTPLHCAVRAARQVRVVRRLIQNRQVRLDVPNNMGMRPIDVSWTTMPLEAYYAWDLRIMIRRSLLSMGAPYGENDRGDLFRKKCIISKEDEEKMSTNLTAASQVLALFSVLITTVTFASAFTLPGGSRSAGDGSGGVAGTPVLGGPRRSYAFDAFILADVLAFGFSLLATSILLYAGVPAGSIDNRFRLINFAYGLMWQSARSLLAAFGLGLFMVLLPVARSIAIAVAVFMILLSDAFHRKSEGINSIGNIPMIGFGRSRRQLSSRDQVIGLILFFFNHYLSYILIFGFPAMRRWPRFTLSPY